MNTVVPHRTTAVFGCENYSRIRKISSPLKIPVKNFFTLIVCHFIFFSSRSVLEKCSWQETNRKYLLLRMFILFYDHCIIKKCTLDLGWKFSIQFVAYEVHRNLEKVINTWLKEINICFIHSILEKNSMYFQYSTFFMGNWSTRVSRMRWRIECFQIE